MTRVRALSLTLTMIAAPALADQFVPPVGCTASLTVQSKNCEVTHVYTCEGDPVGVNWSVTFDNDGPVFVDKIDYETQWLETFHVFQGVRESLITPAADPASLTELLATGIDSYDFRLRAEDGEIRVVGYDQIVGDVLTIDDEPLLPMVFEGRYEDDTGVFMTISGTQYVSEKHRRFFGGIFEVTEDGDTRTWDASPFEFIYPGEPGFLDKTPRYECAASMIGYAPYPQID
ncbi:MAG: hypothetical protein AAF601_00840 [Pseudomonadota bacterium]